MLVAGALPVFVMVKLYVILPAPPVAALAVMVRFAAPSSSDVHGDSSSESRKKRAPFVDVPFVIGVVVSYWWPARYETLPLLLLPSRKPVSHHMRLPSVWLRCAAS